MDVIKVSLPRIFDIALREMLADADVKPCVEELWTRFTKHQQAALETVALGIDYQFEHMHEVFPEIVLDLLCHGPIEKGLDASHGGVEYYTFGVDAAGLATVADSFAALQEKVDMQHRLSWPELLAHLDTDWAGPAGEIARLTMKYSGRFGNGESIGDAWAVRIAQSFSSAVVKSRTPRGHTMIRASSRGRSISSLAKSSAPLQMAAMPATPSRTEPARTQGSAGMEQLPRWPSLSPRCSAAMGIPPHCR